MTLAHWDDVEREVRDVGEMRATFRALGEAAGATAVGVAAHRRRAGLPPRARASARLRGGDLLRARGLGLAWIDGAVHEIGPGDTIVYLASGPAHTVIAGAGGPLRALLRREPRPAARAPAARRHGPPRRAVARGRPRRPARARGRRGRRSSCPRPRPARRAASRSRTSRSRPTRRATSPSTSATSRARPARSAAACATTSSRPAGSTARPTGTPASTSSSSSSRAAARCELYDNRAQLAEEHPLRAGHSVSRPAGGRLAHMLRAGDEGLTYLAYGTRDTGEIVYYPRSRKAWLGRVSSASSSSTTTGTVRSERCPARTQLVVVTGKGGVGKSTVAAALGLVAARPRAADDRRRGRPARRRLARARRRRAMHEEELAPGLHHISIDPEEAMEEYLVDQLPRGAGRRAASEPRLQLLRRRDAGAARAADRRQGLGARPGGPPHARRRPLRPRHPRRARDRPRRRGAERAAHVRRTRARWAASRGRAVRSTRCSPTRRRRASSRSPGRRRCRSTRRSRCEDALRDDGRPRGRPRRRQRRCSPDRFDAADVRALDAAPPSRPEVRAARSSPTRAPAPSAPSSRACAAGARPRSSRCRSCSTARRPTTHARLARALERAL